MKISSLFIVTTIASFALVSCGQKKSDHEKSTHFNNSIVLGAFNDITTPSSLDESKLLDLPKIVDFSKDMTSVKDQSNRGSCTFFSVLGTLEGVIKKDTKM